MKFMDQFKGGGCSYKSTGPSDIGLQRVQFESL
jgi:hypothetical protein